MKDKTTPNRIELRCNHPKDFTLSFSDITTRIRQTLVIQGFKSKYSIGPMTHLDLKGDLQVSI